MKNTNDSINNLIVEYRENGYTFAEIADALNKEQDLNKFQYSAYTESYVQSVYESMVGSTSVGI